jgi:hypothetical protein
MKAMDQLLPCLIASPTSREEIPESHRRLPSPSGDNPVRLTLSLSWCVKSGLYEEILLRL